jgi:hypothetical protein
LSAFCRSLSSHPFAVPGSDDGYVRSATGGAIPGPKVPRNGSSRSDIPNFGILGDDIDPRHIYSSKRSPSKHNRKVQLAEQLRLQNFYISAEAIKRKISFSLTLQVFIIRLFIF